MRLLKWIERILILQCIDVDKEIKMGTADTQTQKIKVQTLKM